MTTTSRLPYSFTSTPWSLSPRASVNGARSDCISGVLGRAIMRVHQIIALRDHDVVMRAQQRLIRAAVQAALAPLVITDRSVLDLGAAGVSMGDRLAFGRDGSVHGVEQIGRGTVI